MRRGLVLVSLLACSSPTRPPVDTTVSTGPAGKVAPAAPRPAPNRPEMRFADAAPAFAFRDPARRTKLEAAFPAIEKMLEHERAKQNLPGFAFGIVIDGELAYAKGFGVRALDSSAPPDADTVYRIGSITKSFTGLALLALRDDGLLELDDPLVKWVPEATGLVYPTRDSRPITLRQLANHTSGLPRMGTFDPDIGPSEAVVLTSLEKLPLETTPGTLWSYSNLGFGLLGIAISRAAKLPFRDVVATRILKPLGMTASVWDHDQVASGKLAPAYAPSSKLVNAKPARLGAIAGAGSLYSSVRDMAKYVGFQLAAYPPRDAEDTGQIRRSTVREAHSTGVQNFLKRQPPIAAISYGFGWNREHACKIEDLVGHGGAIESYRANVAFSPARGVGVIVMTNFGTANTELLISKAIDELHQTGALEARAPQASAHLRQAAARLLAAYQQWDRPAFEAALSRPLDPSEPGELAGYKQLHGECRGIEPARIESATSGSFRLQCERGDLEMRLDVDSRGLISGFLGFSRGVTPPARFARTAQAMVALQNKWDQALFARHLASGPLPAARAKALAAQVRQRHGTCKLGAPIHEGLDWGYEVRCTREHVEMYLTTAPDDLSQVVRVNLRPLRDAPKQCD